MIGLGLLIFATVLGVMLLTIWLGWKVVTAQRRQHVTAVVGSAAGTTASVAAQAAVLVQQGGDRETALSRLLARLDAVSRTERVLDQSGLGWDLTGLATRMGIGFAVGALVGMKLRILMVMVPSMLALGIAAASLPLLYAIHRRKRRLANFQTQFPEALDFLARAIRAGHALPVSLEMLSTESPEPLSTEFKRLYNEQNLGASLPVALRHLADRLPLVDVKFFVSAVLMQRETGGNLGEILIKLSQIIRERFRLEGHVRAVSSHARLTAIVLTCLPIITILILMATTPSYLMSLLEEKEGKYLIMGAVIGQGLGYLTMKRIINIKV